MKINSNLIKGPKQINLDKLFETEINPNNNLYFDFSFSKDYSLLSFSTAEYIKGYRDDSTYIWKKVCFFSGDIKKEIDNFIPIQNGDYFVFSKTKDNQVYVNFPINDKDYDPSIDSALKIVDLLKDEQEVILVEGLEQSKRITYSDSKIIASAFSEDTDLPDVFIYSSGGKKYSNLSTKEYIDSFDLEKITSYFPMGYTTLFFVKRLQLIGRHNTVSFNSIKKSNGSLVLYDKSEGRVASFESYKEVEHFIKRKNKPSSHKSEYLVCNEIESMSWH